MESTRALAGRTQSAPEAPEIVRRRLKDALRSARESAGLTQKTAAQELDWSLSKIIRIEQGAVSVSRTDVEALLKLYGVEDESQVKLLAKFAQKSRKLSWSEYKGAYSQTSLTFFAYESAAKSILKFEPTFLPGLFQTEEYMRALLIGLGRSNDQVELMMEGRLARQELLQRSQRPELNFIIGEASLSRPIGGRRVMLHQLDHLKELATLPGITIQVLTFDVGVHPSMAGAFTLLIFDDLDDLLYLESATGDYIHRDEPELISEYRVAFAELEAVAAPPSELSTVLDEISKVRFE